MHENNFHLLQNIETEKLIKHIDWNFFFAQWDMGGRFPEIFDHPTRGAEARSLYNDAQELLPQLNITASATYRLMKAERHIDDIILSTCDCCPSKVRLPMLRNQTTHFKSAADFVTTEYNIVTPFALCVHNHSAYDDPYKQLLSQILCDRLADALSTYLTLEIEHQTGHKTIPMAFGYPATPDHSPKRLIFTLLDAEKRLNMRLTENYSMVPTSSVCGIMFSNPDAHYFSIGYIGQDQVCDYAARAAITTDELCRLIPNNLLPLP